MQQLLSLHWVCEPVLGDLSTSFLLSTGLRDRLLDATFLLSNTSILLQ